MMNPAKNRVQSQHIMQVNTIEESRSVGTHDNEEIGVWERTIKKYVILII